MRLLLMLIILAAASCSFGSPGGKKKGGKDKRPRPQPRPGRGPHHGRHASTASTATTTSSTTTATTTPSPTQRLNRPVKVSKFNDNMDRNGPVADSPPMSERRGISRLAGASDRRGFGVTSHGVESGAATMPRTRQTNGNRLSPEEKELFLNAHNEFRGSVSPTAANMVQMQWDDSLAQMAQGWSDGCTFGHGNPDNISPYSWVGQNIWAGSGTGWDHFGMVEDWYDEVAEYNYAANSCSGVCGHYTQVVWAESSHVGCAVTTCSTIANLGWSPATILVCNYGEGGNYVGMKPYVSGQPCTQCPSAYPNCVDNLCGSGTDPDGGTNPGSGTDPDGGTNPGSGTDPDGGTNNPGSGTDPDGGTNPGSGMAGCGGTLTSAEGSFTSPAWASPYGINQHCQWIIQGQPGEKVTLTMTYMDIEAGTGCPWDYLLVQQSASDPGNKYCGMQTPTPITADGEVLLVTFHSDYSVTRGGFTANYKIVGSQQDTCGGTLTRTKGVIKTPGYPKPYPTNQDCLWTIQVPKNKRVAIWFTDFDIEDHESCSYDSVTLRLGDEKIPMTLCGSLVSDGQYTSIGRGIQLRFKSDHVTGRKGFRAQFKAVS